MALRHLGLSKHERVTVKLLLEIRKRLQAEKTEEALEFVQATLDAYHQPRPPKRGAPCAGGSRG